MSSLWTLTSLSPFSWEHEVIPWLLRNYAYFAVPLILYPYLVHNTKMKTPMSLDGLLLVWNLAQFVFSLYIFVLVSVPFVSILVSPGGFHESVCMNNPATSYLSQGYGRYIFYFVLSKIADLVDTAFIVLRGKPVAFLHWYHHWVTLFVSYVQSLLKMSTIPWVVFMNSFVHTLMYFHFALATVFPRFKGNRWLTAVQILQMFVGTIVVIWHWLYCGSGLDVPGLTVYVIYLYLFAVFFTKRYEKKSSEISEGAKSKSS